MVRRCLSVTCPPGGRVLDPFGGAGTVAVVAAEMGCPVTSIDQNPNYIEEARRRVLAHAQSVSPPIAPDPDPDVTNDNLASAMREGD